MTTTRTPPTATDRADRTGRALRWVLVLLLVLWVHGSVMCALGSARPWLPSGRGEAVVATVVTVRTVALSPVPPMPQALALAMPSNTEPAPRPSVPDRAAKNAVGKVQATALTSAPKPAPMLTKPEAPAASPGPQPWVAAAVPVIAAEESAPGSSPEPVPGPAPEPAPEPTSGGASVLAREALRDLPSYPVALPPSQHLRFKVRRGDAMGQGALEWVRREGRYQASLRLDGESLPKLAWTSQGETEPGSGVTPQRMVTHRGGRPAAAANFMLEQQKATFSGARIEQPFVRGGQDRITWMFQLAGVFNARAAAADPQARVANAPRAGEQVLLYVVGPRGSAELWNFKVLGPEMLGTEAGEVPSLRLVREADRLYDTRIDIWLDPARHHLPLKWRQQQHGTTQLPLEWERIED